MAVLELLHGDCRTVMAGLPAASVDAVVCDPPYGLSFMGKDWDHGVPGVAFWSAALRVAKPGAHLLAFGGTRTFHRLAVAIEDAGWEIRDTVMWVYGSGFPKSHDVGKGIDKAAGAEREVVGQRDTLKGNGGSGNNFLGESPRLVPVTAPATAAAQQWDGWGTALKPAWEPIIVARKPLEGTVAANVLAHGTGALNIDGCRVVGEDIAINRLESWSGFGQEIRPNYEQEINNKGRWPANLIHDGSDEVVGLFPETAPSRQGKPRGTAKKGLFANSEFNKVGTEHNDSGSAARFFYCAKASRADRDEGCDGIDERKRDAGRKEGNPGGDNPRNRGVHERRNHHPTVKPTALMRYLCKLVTRLGGTVLDPFCGSGSTGKAAILEGFRFIGIEKEFEYCEIANARISKTDM